jgi:hypothetical protein
MIQHVLYNKRDENECIAQLQYDEQVLSRTIKHQSLYYFKWKLHSTRKHNKLTAWDTAPFQDNNLTMIPPQIPFEEDDIDSFDSESDEDEGLSVDSILRFKSKLRHLKPRRDLIGDLMLFLVDNSDTHSVLLPILVSSLEIQNTSLENKVARLFLFSDLLYNTDKAWKYRIGMENALGRIFSSLCDYTLKLNGKDRKVMEYHVSNILDTWKEWMVFAPDVIEQCRNIFYERMNHIPAENDRDRLVGDHIQDSTIHDKPKLKFKNSFQEVDPDKDEPVKEIESEPSMAQQFIASFEQDYNKEIQQISTESESNKINQVPQPVHSSVEQVNQVIDGTAMPEDLFKSCMKRKMYELGDKIGLYFTKEQIDSAA